MTIWVSVPDSQWTWFSIERIISKQRNGAIFIRIIVTNCQIQFMHAIPFKTVAKTKRQYQFSLLFKALNLSRNLFLVARSEWMCVVIDFSRVVASFFSLAERRPTILLHFWTWMLRYRGQYNLIKPSWCVNWWRYMVVDYSLVIVNT